MSTIEVKVPDIGDFKDVPIIEVFVKPGDTVKAEDSLVTLESDKATMDVPSPAAGVVKDLRAKVGDKVSEGSLILTLDSNGAGATAGAPKAASSPTAQPAPARSTAAVTAAGAAPQAASRAAPSGAAQTIEVKVPDIGDFKDVPIIEVFVKPGDSVKAEDPLITLESDKATMDVPSPSAGTIQELKVKLGDKVSEGSVILTLAAAGTAASAPSPPAPAKAAAPAPAKTAAPAQAAPAPAAAGVIPVKVPDIGDF